jgi:hypothetical protein
VQFVGTDFFFFRVVCDALNQLRALDVEDHIHLPRATKLTLLTKNQYHDLPVLSLSCISVSRLTVTDLLASTSFPGNFLLEDPFD